LDVSLGKKITFQLYYKFIIHFFFCIIQLLHKKLIKNSINKTWQLVNFLKKNYTAYYKSEEQNIDRLTTDVEDYCITYHTS